MMVMKYMLMSLICHVSLGQHNDSRMNVALALTAIYYGATVVNHMEVTKLLKKEIELPPHSFLAQNKSKNPSYSNAHFILLYWWILLESSDGSLKSDVLYGATVKDALTGESFEVYARVTI
jgi:hypothetical protein